MDKLVVQSKQINGNPLLTKNPDGMITVISKALQSLKEVEEEAKQVLFHIREGARFHDGKPCEAEDILAMIQGILGSVDMFGMKWSYSRYLARATLSAPTRGTVLVENPEPFADILDIFSEFFV